jgi:hypothetical protein
MGNLSLATPPEQVGAFESAGHAAIQQSVCVASFGEPIAEDYAEFVRVQGVSRVASIELPMARASSPCEDQHGLEARATGQSLVLFLKARLTVGEKRELDRLLADVASDRIARLCIVSSFRVHLGDADAIDAETHVVRTARRHGLRPTVIRAAHVLTDRSPLLVAAGRWGCFYPIVPARLRSCFLSGSALFTAIEQERNAQSIRSRIHTLLGTNLPWRQVLASNRSTGPFAKCLTLISSLLSLLMLGHFAGAFVSMLARRSPRWRSVNVQTLRPTTFRELRALNGPHNFRHVKIVGYNNGVNHFGHRYPGRTIVSTVHLKRVIGVGPGVLRADCGATVRKARDVALASSQDLPVIPNYSYVCLGTAFFVPIHGSASDYSCIAETITRVVLFDPADDRIIVADHGSEAFRHFAYDTESHVLLLRLYCRVKPRQSYFLRTQELDSPVASDLLNALGDTTAANVEIRKPSASGTLVKIFRYYTQAPDTASSASEIARDSIGKLWDRLEENPITSFLMHALTRHLAFHVELFFTPEQFEKFWETHRGVPLKKIQLRYIRADGLTNSPFRERDCISSDMFMLRWHRRTFEEYLARTFGPGTVRANPGKHSC